MAPPQDGSRNPLFRSRWSLALGLGIALVVLAATILWSGLHLRRHIRSQIANRDGEALEEVALMLRLEDQKNEEALGPLDDPSEQLQLVMKISQLRSVLGVRLFSPDGLFVNAVPAYISEAALPKSDLAILRELKPVSHFYPTARMQEQDLLAGTNDAPVPLLEVNVPLRSESAGRLAGVAQFLVNGASIGAQYARVDRELVLQSAVAFLAGGSVLAAGLVLAFRRVQRANRLLAERTTNLLQANRQLALAAKTSAVGAVTFHLIHGLKNPLSGLQNFVRDHAAQEPNGGDTEWELAVATTRRMEALINRVVNVLQQDEAVAEYELTLGELGQMAATKLEPVARAAGVHFEANTMAEGALSNREADLVLLILENLIQNAIESTPVGKVVRLRISDEDNRVVMEVQDQGPGLPGTVMSHLFAPCASTKKHGSGIGLAISQQLAKHLGAVLSLKSSSSEGCIFQLTLAPRSPKELSLSNPSASEQRSIPIRA